MTLWIAPLGLAVGLLLGSLGGGGAILTVPILVYILGQTPRAATAGSLIIVGLTSAVGLIPHVRAHRVRVVEGLTFGVLGILGSLVGSRASASVSPHVLMSAFSVLMLAVAGLMAHKWFQSRRVAKGSVPVAAVANVAVPVGAAAAPVCTSGTPGPLTSLGLEADGLGGPDSPLPVTANGRGKRARALKVVVAATAVGLLTGFFGVGGGFAVVPALVLALGFSMPMAVGTSLLVIVLNSATALASRLGGGLELDWPLLLTFSVFGAAGSLLGGKVAQRIDPRTLSAGFTVMLVLVAGYVAAVNVPALF